MEKGLTRVNSTAFKALAIIIILAVLLKSYGYISNVDFSFSFDPLSECIASTPAPNLYGLFTQNRHRFMNSLSLPNTTALLIPGRKEVIFDEVFGNTGSKFKQDSNFLYLLGISVPNLKALILANGSAIVYLPTDGGVFDGHASASVIEKEYQVEVKAVNSLETDKKSFNIINLSENLLEKLKIQRQKKSKLEIGAIKYASKVSAKSHEKLTSLVKPSASEYSLYSAFVHLTSICRCRLQAYEPIVASHDHASVLHYQNPIDIQGVSKVGNSGFVLIDAGGNYKGYATDITRTYAIDGKWTKEMKEIYKIVKEANENCIEQMKPGVLFSDLTQVATNVIFKGLREIGILNEKSTKSDVRYFFPHGLGHTVGIDVHDSQLRTVLEEDDIWTIEPGVYFNEELLEGLRKSSGSVHVNWTVVDRLLEIKIGGVRIEDVVLVTKDGHEVLSKDAPK